MNEAFTINREFLFKNSIHEITSISIEHNYDINGSFVEGEFIVSGDYRLHEISINKEDFSFKIPFKHEIKSNINLDSIELEITDFKYDFQNEDELNVHVEYVISGEQSLIEFEDEKSLDEFLESTDAEVVDLSEDKLDKPLERQDTEDYSMPIDYTEEVKEDTIVEDKKLKSEETIDQNLILNSVKSEESYVKYHVHTVTMEDSIESICAKYGVSVNLIKKYNTFDNLELNMKLIIPENEEN